jgi:RHS repeat-associated protein
LVYNAQNQVTSISNSGGSGPVTQTYSDQGNNIRLSHGNDNFTTGGPLGVTAKKNGTAITYWTRDPDGQIIYTHGASGTYFYELDRLGSTMALIATDGTKAGGYTYDPYGKTTAVSGTSTTAAQNNPWRYIGGYQNPTDGFYKFGARYYDSAGHFNQQDPVAGNISRPEKFNSYSYTSGDPVNVTDLEGTYGTKEGNGELFGSFVAAVAAEPLIGAEPLRVRCCCYLRWLHPQRVQFGVY